MLTKDIKKGTMVMLRNGWKAKTLGSARNTSCFCEVYGLYTECGSVYSHDIVGVQIDDGSWVVQIEYSKGQIKCREMANKFF